MVYIYIYICIYIYIYILLSLREFRRPFLSRLGDLDLRDYVKQKKVDNDLFGLKFGKSCLNSCLVR